MKTRLKVALSAAAILVGVVMLSRFFQWMNRPSDYWLFAGTAGALSLFVLVPGVIRTIWRSDILNHKRP